ncbi:MAG: energy-coupled thiamine transporter ThiT [Mogibacterium sp.]|nr:energy-coupled thiamine transporter ThiT [Mogibacterium sp.]
MSKNNTDSTNNKTRMLAEGGICIAMAIALSFIKIPIGLSFGGFGGSIDLVMLPLVFFALKWGAKWGCLAGLIFGTLKYFLASGFAISWVSMIFDYSVAYAAVGLAGLFAASDKTPGPSTSAVAALVGCLARFVIHFISGVTVYAQYMPEEFMNLKMTSPAVYSLLYNGTYMVPNTIICVVAIMLLNKPLRQLFAGK